MQAFQVQYLPPKPYSHTKRHCMHEHEVHIMEMTSYNKGSKGMGEDT